MSKKISGVVVAKSGQQTISVRVDRRVNHPKYGKQLTKSKKYLVHDPANTAAIGEKVTIVSSRPISKNKKYTLISEATPAIAKPASKVNKKAKS